MAKFYPDSKVELSDFTAKNYDKLMNILTFGRYKNFIEESIRAMDIRPDDHILDFGAGTGRNALLMHSYLSEKGEITGLEISEQMLEQFEEKIRDIPNIEVLNQRIDQPFDLDKKFDKVFISFVLHGFPHPVREQIIQNAFNALKPGGEFIILDFNEFILEDTPLYFRIPFKKIECKYAFDFIARDWKAILRTFGFKEFEEIYFFHQYVRILKAVKG